jgi:hypothetical protein
MRYIKNSKNFEKTLLFESDNLAQKIDKIENEFKKAGVNLKDLETQEVICADLAEMFAKNEIEPEYKKLDMEKISDRVQAQMKAQTQVQKDPKKIDERFRNIEFINESSQFTEDALLDFWDDMKKLPDLNLYNEVYNFGKKDTILQKLRPSEVKDEEILRMEKELLEALGDLEKKKRTTNFLGKIGTKILNFFGKIIGFLAKISGYIKKLVFSCVNWICRNVFGMSHQGTSKYGGMFAGCVMMTAMAIIFAPIIAAGIAVVSGGAVISAVTAAVSAAASIGSTTKIIGYILYLSWWYLTTADSKYWMGFLEFLDELEKKAKRKLKISSETREFLTKMDKEHNIKMRSTKIDIKKNKEENEKVRVRYFEFHEILKIYIKKHTVEEIGETFSIFGKILDDKEPSNEDKNQFRQWRDDYISGLDKLRAKYDDDTYALALKTIHGSGYDTLRIKKLIKAGKEIKEIADELNLSIEEVEEIVGKENEQLKKFRKDAETIPESMFYYNTSNQKTADYLTSLIKNYGMEAKPIKGDKFKVGIYSGDKLLTTITNSMYEKRRKESIEEFKNTVLSVLKKRSETKNESFRFGKISKFRAYRY